MTPTLKQIAGLAKTTEATVSLVINGRQYHRVSKEVRRRIEAIAAKLCYVPNRTAQVLARGRTDTIAILVDEVTSPFCASYIQLIDRLLEDRGYTLFPMITHADPKRESQGIGWLSQRYFDGVICLEYDLHNRDVYRNLDARLPLVVRGWDLPNHDCSFPQVRVNYEVALRRLCEHLARTGRRHIGVLARVAEKDSPIDWANPRWKMYRTLFQDTKLDCPPQHWMRVPLCGDELLSTEIQTHALLSRAPQIDTIIVHGPTVLPAVCHAARDMGRRIGDDLAIVSFDDLPVTRYLAPKVSIIREPTKQIAEHLVRMLLARIQDSDSPAERIEIDGELLIYESSKDIAAESARRISQSDMDRRRESRPVNERG